MKTLKFHTGRGGQFNNPGHVTFKSFETIDGTRAFDAYFTREERKGFFDFAGNELDYLINEDGTGYLLETL